MGNAQAGIRLYLRYLRETGLEGEGGKEGKGGKERKERREIEARIANLRKLEARQQAPTIKPPPAQGALASEARSFFERGRQLYRRGKYRAAYQAFAAARQFVALPELSYNLAQVCEKLDRGGDAIDHYRAYLAEAPDAADATQVRNRIDALSRARK